MSFKSKTLILGFLTVLFALISLSCEQKGDPRYIKIQLREDSGCIVMSLDRGMHEINLTAFAKEGVTADFDKEYFLDAPAMKDLVMLEASNSQGDTLHNGPLNKAVVITVKKVPDEIRLRYVITGKPLEGKELFLEVRPTF